jgi:L-lactate dehydrogenase (cytochrome)
VRTLADIALHPGWWFDVLTTEPLRFASLDAWHGPIADLIDQLFDPALSLNDLAWLRTEWTGPLIVKGIQTADDARAVADAGADAIVISNHGGRQLDRAPIPLEQLPAIVTAVGDDVEVYLDGGIMNGGDVVAALGMGARACLVGRAYLYGLMAGGEAGVQRAADLLTRDIARTMRLLGANDLTELTAERVRLRDH